eukprot:m.20131 g.20131  ORF g.20131 m.20131 type:complete len:289 (+) comp3504_c0_seq1:136-1002(+)
MLMQASQTGSSASTRPRVCAATSRVPDYPGMLVVVSSGGCCRHSLSSPGSLFQSALIAGNGAQMVRVFPYAAVQFYSYERYRQILPRMFGRETEVLRFLSGSLAGVSAVCLTYPLDLVRARLAFQVTTVYYKGIVEAIRIIAKEEGVKGFYKGVAPTIMGMIPYAGVSFFVFGSIKQHMMQYPHLRKDPHRLKTAYNMAAGAAAGIMAQTLSYPLDVVRRRMQIDRSETPHYRSTLHALKAIYTEHGLYKGLFRGLSINWIREAPQIAVAFTAHELLKDMFGINTHPR